MGNRFLSNSLFSLFACLSGIVGIAHAQDSPIQYFHPDHLGSASLVTKQNAVVVESIAYAPFGEILTPHLSSSPQRGEERGEGASYLFTNQELDPESDLYDYGARFYDAALSRFVSTDRVLENPPYAYVHNNPIQRTDPNGKDDENFQELLDQFQEAAKEVARAESDLDRQVTEQVVKEYGIRLDSLTMEQVIDIAGRADENPETEPARTKIMESESVARRIAEQLKWEIDENPELIEELNGRHLKLYLRLTGGLRDTYNFSPVENPNNGPMVFPVTPGASAPTTWSGSMHPPGIRDFIIYAILAINIPWNTGREALPIQTPGPRDGISCMGIACSSAEVLGKNLVLLYAPLTLFMTGGGGGAVFTDEAWWAWRAAAAVP
ncbi:MAG: RHS repeat-associated core domain-containing protein [Deltaproteobacteria bacterium]|nr:RHS repeat-associated core domain-containing protein [Deltaproteobacteria bacterium]